VRKQLSFKPNTFQENIEGKIGDGACEELICACEAYALLTTPMQKAHSLHGMMDILDRELDDATRYGIMEACGRQCIGASTLEKARRLQKDSNNLDDLLTRLNEAHIGGGHLRREENTIHGAYDRCYCGSVSQSREKFSDTYCHCSCGWYHQLFEALLGRPVEVELLGSILQGAERCEFQIHY
jgi:predicted hydrocarbon binding protein